MATNDDNDIKPRTTRDWHLYYLSIDKDFTESLSLLSLMEKKSVKPKLISEARMEIASFFHITAAELGMFEIGKVLFINKNEGTTQLQWDTNTKKGTLTFDLLKTTKAEIDEQFAVILSLRKEVWNVTTSLRSGVRNPELVFAIFKARQNNTTFIDIFNLYDSKTLPHYSKAPSQFKDPKQLENFYNKYKP